MPSWRPEPLALPAGVSVGNARAQHAPNIYAPNAYARQAWPEAAAVDASRRLL
ncbi:MAG TPA: hypothetical protein VGO95_07865 [Modestobacter sp.]|nr:hypothetical protein [Modestobacter sp.]